MAKTTLASKIKKAKLGETVLHYQEEVNYRQKLTEGDKMKVEMECENCKRKNDLLRLLAFVVEGTRLDINKPLVEEARKEAEKSPNVLLVGTKKSPSSSSA